MRSNRDKQRKDADSQSSNGERVLIHARQDAGRLRGLTSGISAQDANTARSYAQLLIRNLRDLGISEYDANLQRVTTTARVDAGDRAWIGDLVRELSDYRIKKE